MARALAIQAAQFALQVQLPDGGIVRHDVALLGQAVGDRLEHTSATKGPQNGPCALMAVGCAPDMPAAHNKVQSPFSPASGLISHSMRVVSPRQGRIRQRLRGMAAPSRLS